MPSVSPSQARLMAAAAHTPGGYGGVPQSVGKEFNQADKGTGIIKPKGTKGENAAKKRKPSVDKVARAMASSGAGSAGIGGAAGGGAGAGGGS